MDYLILLVGATVFYSALYFFDIIFRSCSHYPYIQLMNYLGLEVSFFKITWFTTSFNRSFQRWGSFRPKILLQWYSAGVWFTVILLPVSFYLLLHSVFSVLPFGREADASAEAIIVPVIPGVNLPLSDIGYYVFTLGIASAFHEIGHVAAARREDVTVAGVGMVFAFLLPAAYVKFGQNQIEVLAPKRQLRILCAGIWHNVVLAGFAYIFLTFLPFILYPAYNVGRGVVVTDIVQNSPVTGPMGLVAGDSVLAMNDCEISDVERWRHCLLMAMRQSPPGYCINEDLVHKLDESIPGKHIEGGIVECCDKRKVTHLCFEALEDEGPLPILQYSCLPGRPVVEATAYSCRKPRDCPAGLHCVRPVLGNATTLLRIQRLEKPVVIFIGKPRDVLETVTVSAYIPVFQFLGPDLPEMLIKLCKYFAVLSSGFAIVNIVPCFFSDGNHIIYALLRYVGASKIRKQRLVGLGFNIVGASLLGVNFLAMLWKGMAR